MELDKECLLSSDLLDHSHSPKTYYFQHYLTAGATWSPSKTANNGSVDLCLSDCPCDFQGGNQSERRAKQLVVQ